MAQSGIGQVIGSDRPHTITMPTGHVLTRVFGGNSIYIYDVATWRYGKDVNKAQRFEQPTTVGVRGPGWYTFSPAQKADAKREDNRRKSAEIALARSQALATARQEASGTVTATARPSDTRVTATAVKKAPKAPKAVKATKAASSPEADEMPEAPEIHPSDVNNASQDARGEHDRYVRPDAGQPVIAAIADETIDAETAAEDSLQAASDSVRHTA